MRKRGLVASCVVALATALHPTAARADSFDQGSLVIPMDTTYQDKGMLKAYGLVYNLLFHGVPVRWVIQKGKAFQSVDFTASAKDHVTQAAVNAHGYRGGPFVVDAADAAKAIPFINAWQTANPTTTVHEATAPFSGDVARYLVVAPRVAMHADGNQQIAVAYLNAAGIPDSNGNPWPNTSPDLLTPAQVAGPTTTNHHDGALFDADGDPVYCQFMSMHWNVTEAQATPEVVAEVRQYLTSPVHFFAECQAVDAFEDLVPYGHFLTPNGFVVKQQPNAVDFYHADITFAQIDGAFGTIGGSEPAYALPAGDSYKAGGVTMLTAHGFAEGQYDLWMTGYLDGACGLATEYCGTLGKVSYLGGHQYTTNVPISTNPKTQGVRLFLNSLFDSTCASLGGQPFLTLSKTAPATTVSSTVTFTLDYGNSGPTVALAASVTDPLPPGAAFVSATNGGTFANGKVTWNVGNLGVGESGEVAVTVQLATFGTYQNTAQLAYKVGLNPFTLASNTTATLYDKDTDGDGVLDSVDICPNNFDPAQDLATDVLSCGACGVVCTVANGVPGCAGGVCDIAACLNGFSDCDGKYADGCEYASQGFGADPSNCGGCGVVCSFQHAGAACNLGACALGACSAGYSDCNGISNDGCEYSNTGFATDAGNCGSCGHKCSAGFVCQGGSCVVSNCPAGFSDCDGTPGDGCEYSNVNFATDPSNCGGCNILCAPAHATGKCVGGQCAVNACAAGYSDCNGLPGDGCEVDDQTFATDPSNCGGCKLKCAPAHGVGACQLGGCVVAACAPGFSDCDGTPGDGCEYADGSFATDPGNCGGCGALCALPNAVASCSGGVCAVGACLPGFVDLDQNPANGCEYACTKIAASDTTCDGVDDDCDGQIDEDYVPVTCGQGACAALSVCTLGAVACAPGTPSVEGPKGSPSCSDGIDNDCDGLTDGADQDCQVAGCQTDADCDDGDPCTTDTCVNAFCTHAGVVCDAGPPGTGGSGGGASSSTSDGGASASAGAGGATSGSGGAMTPGDKGSCACRSAPSGDAPGGGLALVALGLLAAGGRRSRCCARPSPLPARRARGTLAP